MFCVSCSPKLKLSHWTQVEPRAQFNAVSITMRAVMLKSASSLRQSLSPLLHRARALFTDSPLKIVELTPAALLRLENLMKLRIMARNMSQFSLRGN